MSDGDRCETPREMLSDDLETEFVDSAEELERRIAADLRAERTTGSADDTAPDGGREE